MTGLRRGHYLGEWEFTTSGGEDLCITKGWLLTGAARRGALMGRWYVTTQRRDQRLGNADGYLLLRDVRLHIAAAERDAANGFDVTWGAS
jgi:hypothetical protein